MAQITYADKVALNVNSNIADINKVNASDMNEIKQVVNDNANTLDNKISNTYGISQTEGYSQEYINGLQTPIVSTVGNITFMKIGHIVIMNGKLPSNAQEGTVTLPYTTKYYFGFGFTGYFPANGNTQAYGYAVAEAGSTTLKYRASAAFTDAPISSIYYTDD